jgi:hypothetical protein
VDVTKTAPGHRYVLRRYLDVVVYLGPLAVQAFSRPGSDIRGQSFPYLPGGDEAADCLYSRVGSPVGGQIPAGGGP